MNRRSAALLIFLLGALSDPEPAMAYIGPGSGLSAIGVFVALIVGVILAIMGFIWYPIKRLVRKWRRTAPSSEDRNE